MVNICPNYASEGMNRYGSKKLLKKKMQKCSPPNIERNNSSWDGTSGKEIMSEVKFVSVEIKVSSNFR